ncbi:M23 family metallopeptidase [Paenibacillus alvei]|uniref:M23 family metallopeptidase n=1 Tax=Paenibacillus alvei TaxID=44250 RepID=UPI002281A63F|nr:M23 family metallopeptidase [Paenibacillus alvei]
MFWARFAIKNWKIVLPAAIVLIFLGLSIVGFLLTSIVGGIMSPFSFFFGSDDEVDKKEIVQEYVKVGEQYNIYWPDLAAYDFLRTEGTFEDINKASIQKTLDAFSYFVETCTEKQESANGRVTTKKECTKTRYLRSLQEVLSQEGKSPADIENAKFISENMLAVMDDNNKESNVPGGTVVIDPEVITSDTFIWPVPTVGYISDTFGERINPVTNKAEYHKGMDISNGQYGVPIVATTDGYVVHWNDDSSSTCGKWIRLQHEDGYQSRYCHMKKLEIKEKTDGKPTTVKKGQVIGYIGSTGQSTGPHLHFEMRKNGQLLNPMTLVAKSRPKDR